MEGTIGTPPLQEDPLQGFCSDLWKFLSCGPETGPVTAQHRALHGGMDPWLPRVTGAVTAQDRALHGGKDPYLGLCEREAPNDQCHSLLLYHVCFCSYKPFPS